MTDVRSHRDDIPGTSEEEIERRIRKHRRWDHEAKESSETNTGPAKTQREGGRTT
jgi:hypothetical protein